MQGIRIENTAIFLYSSLIMQLAHPVSNNCHEYSHVGRYLGGISIHYIIHASKEMCSFGMNKLTNQLYKCKIGS